MDTPAILLLALALAMDAFAVSTTITVVHGMASARQRFRIAFHFGLFQALLPVLGWWGGSQIEALFHGWNHAVTAAILGFVGGRAIWGALFPRPEQRPVGDPSKGLSLVLLSLAVSLDAMAVGVGFAAVDLDPWYPALWIGLVASAMSLVGLRLGERLGEHFGRWAELAGGLVLVAIGLRVLIA